MILEHVATRNPKLDINCLSCFLLFIFEATQWVDLLLFSESRCLLLFFGNLLLEEVVVDDECLLEQQYSRQAKMKDATNHAVFALKSLAHAGNYHCFASFVGFHPRGFNYMEGCCLFHFEDCCYY